MFSRLLVVLFSLIVVGCQSSAKTVVQSKMYEFIEHATVASTEKVEDNQLVIAVLEMVYDLFRSGASAEVFLLKIVPMVSFANKRFLTPQEMEKRFLVFFALELLLLELANKSESIVLRNLVQDYYIVLRVVESRVGIDPETRW